MQLFVQICPCVNLAKISKIQKTERLEGASRQAGPRPLALFFRSYQGLEHQYAGYASSVAIVVATIIGSKGGHIIVKIFVAPFLDRPRSQSSIHHYCSISLSHPFPDSEPHWSELPRGHAGGFKNQIAKRLVNASHQLRPRPRFEASSTTAKKPERLPIHLNSSRRLKNVSRFYSRGILHRSHTRQRQMFEFTASKRKSSTCVLGRLEINVISRKVTMIS